MNMMLLRCITAGCAAFMVLGLGACSGQETPASSAESSPYNFGGMTITIADQWGRDMTPGVDEKTNAFIEKVHEIEEKYNITFEWKKIDSGTYWNDMATRITGGDPFGDIMYSFPWMITDWIKAGAVKDAGAVAKSVGIDFKDGTWNDFIVDETTYGNTIYGFSKKANTIQSGMLYNKRLLKELSLIHI